jgi:hypothetical protein
MPAGIHGTGRQAQGDDPGGIVGRDVSRDQSGDQAAWRDLVARLELPSAIDPANAPWPDRENLAPAAPQVLPEPDASDAADARDDPGDPVSQSGKEAPANRIRIIMPASFPDLADPVDSQARPAAADAAAGRRDHSPRPDGEFGSEAHADLGFLGCDQDDQDGDEGYVPPYVPPQPKLDPVARGAWTALFGGPGYLFIATTLGWQVPGWAELAAIAAFVAGFVILVSRLGDGPSRRDGPDQGAVV